MRISLLNRDSGGAESANCTGAQRETAQNSNDSDTYGVPPCASVLSGALRRV
jgi:hypothetical protein